MEGRVLDVMVGSPDTAFHKELIMEAFGEEALWVALVFLPFTWAGTTKMRPSIVLSLPVFCFAWDIQLDSC